MRSVLIFRKVRILRGFTTAIIGIYLNSGVTSLLADVVSSLIDDSFRVDTESLNARLKTERR